MCLLYVIGRSFFVDTTAGRSDVSMYITSPFCGIKSQYQAACRHSPVS